MRTWPGGAPPAASSCGSGDRPGRLADLSRPPDLRQRILAALPGEPVDEQDAAQVVGLVLQGPGQFAGAGDRDRVAVTVDAGDDGVHRPQRLGGQAGDGQAALGPVVLTAGLDHDRVEDVSVLAVDVKGECGQADADLRGGQARTPGQQNGVHEVVDQPPGGVIESGHRIALGAEQGIAEQAQWLDRHGHRSLPRPPPARTGPASAAAEAAAAEAADVPSAAAPATPWSPVSLPIRSSTMSCQRSSVSILAMACSMIRSSTGPWSGQACARTRAKSAARPDS